MTWLEGFVAAVQAHYPGSRYVGLYDLPDREGPFHIFYQAELPEEFRDNPK